MSGIVYDPLNGAFATDEERGRARVFTDDGGPGLLAAGVPSTFAGVLDLRTDGALHVSAAAEPFVFAGRLTTDAAAPSTLTFETDSGAPFVFGGPHAPRRSSTRRSPARRASSRRTTCGSRRPLRRRCASRRARR